jgi:hypothetical protein
VGPAWGSTWKAMSSIGPPPILHMQAGSPTNTNSDEIAERFAGFFFRVLATEPEKVCVFYFCFCL